MDGSLHGDACCSWCFDRARAVDGAGCAVIEGWIGRPGSGKTYTLTARALRVWKKYDRVYANYEIAVPNYYPINGPEDLLTISADPESRKGILIILDEAHLWFPARLSMRLPASLLMRLSQTRKAGWDLWWAAQHENRVDRVLRDVTNWMWLCRSWLSGWSPFTSGPLLFTARCFEPENFRKPKKDVVGFMRFYRPSVGAAYNTLDSLSTASHVDAVKDFYRDKK